MAIYTDALAEGLTQSQILGRLQSALSRGQLTDSEDVRKLYEIGGLREFGLEKLSEAEERASDKGATLEVITSPIGSFNPSSPTGLNPTQLQQKLASLQQLRNIGINLTFPNLASRLGVAEFGSQGGVAPINPPAGQFNVPFTATGPAQAAQVPVPQPMAGQPTPQAQPPAQAGQPGQYIKVGNAFFQQSPRGLQAISDPNTLRGLQSGQIPSTQQAEIGGGAGRFAAGSVPLQNQQAQALVQAPPQPSATGITEPPEISNLKTQMGLPADLTSTSIDDVIKKVSTYFGLDETNKELKDLDDKHLEEVASINSNPWLSESLRTRKVNVAQEKHEAKKDALVQRLKLKQDVVGKAITIFEKEREFKKDLLFKQLDLQEKAIDNARQETTSDIREYQFAQKQGFTGTFLQFQAQSQRATTKPTEADLQLQEARNVETILAASRGKDGFVDPKIYQRERLKARMSPSEFDGRFGHLLSPAERKIIGIDKGGILGFDSL